MFVITYFCPVHLRDLPHAKHERGVRFMSDAARFTNGTSALRMDRPEGLRLYEGGAPAHRAGRDHKTHHRLPAELLVAAAVVLAVLAGVSALDGARRASARAQIEAAPLRVVRVLPGDSLWSIASSNGSGRVGTSEVVSWMREENGLTSPVLEVGQEVLVPVLGQ